MLRRPDRAALLLCALARAPFRSVRAARPSSDRLSVLQSGRFPTEAGHLQLERPDDVNALIETDADDGEDDPDESDGGGGEGERRRPEGAGALLQTEQSLDAGAQPGAERRLGRVVERREQTSRALRDEALEDAGAQLGAERRLGRMVERQEEALRALRDEGIDPYDGLPVAEGQRPSWLLRKDQLVVDARTGTGGILIVQTVLTDVNDLWGGRQKLKTRPDWLRAILATNRHHARTHGHAMVLRAIPSQPQLTRWMLEDCGTKYSTIECTARNERENFNWEKHLMVSDYLHSPQRFSHVLMLDADAAMVQPQLDTLRSIAAQLEAAKKDLFLTDEDWLDEHGVGRINGGFLLAKSTPFTQQLFLDTFHAHVLGRYLKEPWGIRVSGYTCTSNEQICLNDLYHGGQGKKIFQPHVLFASGKQYNRGAQNGGEQHITDPATQIMHWMGGSKGSAGRALCFGPRDLTFDGPEGYGCRRG